MIVRIVTARLPSASSSAVYTQVRDQWLPALRAQPGVEYVKLARRVDGDAEQMVLITEWRTVGDLYRWAGDEIAGRHLAEGDEPRFDEWTVEHYESLDRLPDDVADANDLARSASEDAARPN